MKKVFVAVLAVLCVAVMCFAITACDKKAPEVEISVAVPDGAPALAIANLLASSSFDGYKVSYEIVPGDQIAAKVLHGADIAIMPTNAAFKLYSGGAADIKLVAGNTFGLLYLVGTENITGISQLRGQKILCIGQGMTPDFVLQYILRQNGLVPQEDVTIQYISQGSDAIAALLHNTEKFALLGEPAASMAVKNAHASVLLDMQAEWETKTGYSGYPQAGTVVKSDIINNHPAFLKKFLKAMSENVAYIENTENLATINETLQNYNSTTKFASTEVIKRCNVRYEGANEVKAGVISYLEIMKTFDADFVGNKIPDDTFFVNVALD